MSKDSDKGKDKVNIPDQRLRDRIAKELGVPKPDITVEDLAQLTSLDCQFDIIGNLTGLEQAVNLRQLNIKWNGVRDLSPLLELEKLEVLNLAGNGLRELDILRSLTSLHTLDLESNRLGSLEWLTALPKLKKLNLARNKLEDITPVSSLTNLEQLMLDNNELVDLTPVEGLTNLKVLSLKSNNVADLAPLRNLENLEKLVLWSNKITDLSPLAKLYQLRELFVQNNHLNKICCLEELSELSVLQMDSNKIQEVGVLAGLTKLKSLGLWNNPITNIEPLQELNRLEMFTMSLGSDNQLPDLTGYPQAIIRELLSQTQGASHLPKEFWPQLISYLHQPSEQLAAELLAQEPAVLEFIQGQLVKEQWEQILAEELGSPQVSYEYLVKFLLASGYELDKGQFIAQRGSDKAKEMVRQLEQEILLQVAKSPRAIGQNLSFIKALSLGVVEAIKQVLASEQVSAHYIKELLGEKQLDIDKMAFIGAHGSRQAKVLTLDYQLAIKNVLF